VDVGVSVRPSRAARIVRASHAKNGLLPQRTQSLPRRRLQRRRRKVQAAKASAVAGVAVAVVVIRVRRR